MQTIMDYSFPDAASITPWYYHAETDLAAKPQLGTLWGGTPYADINMVYGDPTRRPWWDMNHVHFGPINVLFASWFKTPVGGGGGGTGRAWPSVPSLVDAEVKFRVRAYDLYLPASVRLGLWIQAKVPDVSPLGAINEVYANYFQRVDLLDDVLGFGGRGYSRPKSVWGVYGVTGWRDWTVRMSADDDMWQSMGSRLSKTGTSFQPPITWGYAYGAPGGGIREILESPVKYNMGIIAWWAPTPDLNTPPYPTCPIFGRIQIENIKVDIPD